MELNGTPYKTSDAMSLIHFIICSKFFVAMWNSCRCLPSCFFILQSPIISYLIVAVCIPWYRFNKNSVAWFETNKIGKISFLQTFGWLYHGLEFNSNI